MAGVTFKRGDTFLLECAVAINSVAQDITGWGIKAQIRNGATLVSEAVITKTDATNGVYSLRVDDTTLWPVKPCKIDIKYTTGGGQIVSTETILITVIEDITK